MKSHGSSSRKWCKRRGLEEQRFYEMSKLKRQFESLLRDHHLLDPEQRDKDEEERDRENEKRRELKKLKREHRKEKRKTKMLKLDEDEESGGEKEEQETETDIRDLEFKLTHDLDKLEAGSTARRSFTLRDINLLKIILCSGLYPNLALPDENNTNKRDSEQLFHSKSKQFLQVLPTSVFASRPQLLQLTDTPVNYQLLTYVSLLETSKPYLVHAMRVPALQTLMVFAQSLDTNADLTRFVVDCWLEISLPDNDTGQKVLSAVQRLRATWARLLKLRFEDIKDMRDHSETTRRNKELDLENHLAKKLSEFLDSNVSYSLRRLLPSESRYLYLGPLGQTQGDSRLEDASSPFTGGLEPHPTKGGFRVNEYLTYSCLQDTVMAEAASAAAQYISKHWRCEKCGQKMLVTVLERLQHQEECQHEESVDSNNPAVANLAQSQTDNSAVDSSIDKLRKPYYCNACQSQFSFTSTEILKHKKSHVLST